MDNTKISELREKAVEAAITYHAENEKLKNNSFIPGSTYIPAATKVVDQDDLSHLMHASLDMWLTTGRFGKQFEQELPNFFGLNAKALFVNSGSSANLCGISAFGSPLLEEIGLKPLQKGDEVITTAGGFPTTVNPIVQNGWKPIFLDINKNTLNVESTDILNAINSKTRAIVLAHALGNPYRVDEFIEECKKREIFVFEDCCDAFGAKIGEKPVGSFGHYASLSFYPAHHITTGEGGAVMSNSKALRRVAEGIRDWGRDCWCEPGVDNTCGKRFDWQLGSLPCGYDHKYTYSSIGYNLKATDMQAALGVSQLKKLPSFIKERNKNWNYLNSEIKSCPELSQHFIPVQPTHGTTPSWFGFPMHTNSGLNRNKVVRFLESKKVGTRLFFAGNITRQPAYKDVDFEIIGELSGCDYVTSNTFWIAVHPALNLDKMNYMLDMLKESLSYCKD
jgi:CDP-6-deoxy-D-xylo-4-hexulose-3-dehydrase